MISVFWSLRVSMDTRFRSMTSHFILHPPISNQITNQSTDQSVYRLTFQSLFWSELTDINLQVITGHHGNGGGVMSLTCQTCRRQHMVTAQFYRHYCYTWTHRVSQVTQLSLHLCSGGLSKLGARRPPSTAGTTLTVDLHLTQPCFNRSQMSL